MSVKRTISFSEATLEKLEDLVPKYKRSSFVDDAVIHALQQVAKEKALNLLEKSEKMDASGPSTVEAQRETREIESERLVTHP